MAHAGALCLIAQCSQKPSCLYLNNYARISHIKNVSPQQKCLNAKMPLCHLCSTAYKSAAGAKRVRA